MQLISNIHPFQQQNVDIAVPDGLTLSQALETACCDAAFTNGAHVFIGKNEIPREYWHAVKPKPGHIITVKIFPLGGGGGEDGGKNPLRTILTLAVVVVATVVTYGGAAPYLGSAFAAGSSGALIGGAVVGAGGALLINTIAPIRPPSLGSLSGFGGSNTQRESPSLFIDGARNATRPFGTVPSVLGVHKHVPPLGIKSYTETLGDKNFIRLLVVWGYGPLKIENIKIADTAIANFEGVREETREGRTGDAAITLIPDTVDESPLTDVLTFDAGWITRSTDSDADEISVDVTFGNGLVTYNAGGAHNNASIDVQIQYRESGGSPANPWLTPSFTAKTVPDAWVSGDTVTFTHNRTVVIRHGFRWSVASRGQYDVRIRRVTADSTSNLVYDVATWTVIRTITDENPIQFPYPLAITALEIQATDQLNRQVDELNATVSSYVESYQGSPTWAEAVSSNPADLIRHVLQGNANEARVTDDEINLTDLANFHAFCDTNGFEFNMIRDFTASIWDTVADIAAAGRGSPAFIDDKWTVIYDELQTIPTQHFTPRNSWGFKAEKGFPDLPHAQRVRFVDRDQDWKPDERIVYNDGYNSGNATEFLSLDAPGITDADHVWKWARFEGAQAVARPERWSFNADFEHIACNRGDLVLLTHDVILTGLASGRIESLITDGSSPENITGFVSDEVLTMESGSPTPVYGVSIRTVGDVEVVATLVNDPGDQTTVTLTTPIPLASGPSEGDLFGFGISGNETVEGLVIEIGRQSEMTGNIICVPNSPDIYNADSGVVPPFTGNLVGNVAVPQANITGIRSDESVLQKGSGNTLIPHIGLRIERIDDPLVDLDVQIRVYNTSEPYYDATITAVIGDEALIGEVEQGKRYDVRARWRDINRLPGEWDYELNHLVIGKSNPPSDISSLVVSQNGVLVQFTWALIEDLDRNGADIRRRPVGSTLDFLECIEVKKAEYGTTLTTAAVPPGAWEFLIKARDTSGNLSQNAAAATLTVVNVNTVVTRQEESPRWAGDIINTDGVLSTLGGDTLGTLAGDELTATAALPTFVKDNINSALIPNSTKVCSAMTMAEIFEQFVPYPVAEAVYEGEEIDLTFDADDVRTYAEIELALGHDQTGDVVEIFRIDYRDNADSYDGFENWYIGNIDARFIKGRAVIDTTENVAYLTDFVIVADTEENDQVGKDIVIASGSFSTVTFASPFHVAPVISPTVKDNDNGAYIVIKNITTVGFDAGIFQSHTNNIGGTFDYTATGAF